MRADKWLFHARFFKTRSLATKMIAAGRLRLNGEHVSKPATSIGVGDVVTFAQAKNVRVVRLVSLSTRRGPATEAQTLYEDLTPATESAGGVGDSSKNAGDSSKNSVLKNAAQSPKYEGKGRPTKKDRRNLVFSRQGVLD